MFIWDVTHFCPLQCIYCYSGSGPNQRKTDTEQLWRVARAIVREKPDAVMMSGGEPALVKGMADVGKYLRENGVSISIFTSGWGLDEARLRSLAASFSRIHVSLDSADPETNDRIRNKLGAHRNASNTLNLLGALRKDLPSLRFGIECTVVRSNLPQLEELCRWASKIERICFLNITTAIPSGRASRATFASSELLDENEVNALLGRSAQLREALLPSIQFSVSRNESFFKTDDEQCIQLTPNGDVRAIKICKKTVGNLVEEPLSSILERAAAFRSESPLARRLLIAPNFVDMAEVVRNLDDEVASRGSEPAGVVRH
jgi:MoaA/NifB/PqqE/SkfB family radical SAM enzyme